jgi:drug/metabolite transporter (DMT)-like permease
VGTVLVLTSAIAFGTLAILVKLGYQQGLDAEQLLTFRFTLAGVAMLAISTAAGQNPLRLPGRRVAALLLLGAIGYFGQSITFFLALRQLPASVVELVVYTYPALVALAGWALFRRRLPGIHILALAGSFAGVLLLAGGIRFAGGPGLAFAIACPVLYTAYILIGDRLMAGMPAIAAGALSISGTAIVWVAVAAVTRTLRLPVGKGQWAVVVALAVVPTMIAITAFLAALPRIGAARSALLSTIEPVVTVTLAVILLGDRLGTIQAAGAALILISVVVLQLASPRSSGLPRMA